MPVVEKIQESKSNSTGSTLTLIFPLPLTFARISLTISCSLVGSRFSLFA